MEVGVIVDMKASLWGFSLMQYVYACFDPGGL